MFKTSTPVAESAPVVPAPSDLIPLSHLELDLPAPTTGWLIELDRRGIEVVVDDVGRKSISRADARLLLDEQRENEARAREVAERNERQAIEADRQRRAQLSPGVPWYEIPADLLPVQAMTAAARDESPRRRNPLLDFIDNPHGGAVFHPIQGDES
jgi:hypothetical protein